MTDNVLLNLGSGGETLATDDIGGVQYQIIKMTYGALNAQTLASSGNGTTDAGTQRVTIASDSTGLVKLAAGTNGIGKLTANSGVDIGDVDILSIAAGDNNIGNVDIASALPAGTNAIGKLAANSGVDIGDVDVTSVIPGTGATNLGKAIDSPVGATDTGIVVLGVHAGESAKIAVAEEDYTHLHIGELGGLAVEPEQHNHLDEMDVTTGWTVLGNDTLNLATTKKHLTGTDALTFDKVNGAANTVFAGIQKTITTVDMGELDLHDIVQTVCFISSLTDVNYVFVRIGTDSTNYNEWQVPVADLTAGVFTILGLPIGSANHGAITGNGVDWGAISYISVGVAFNAETNTLSGIIFDQLGLFTGSHVSASFASEVTSTVNTANINVQKIGGSPTDKNSGNKSVGSQRIVIATDDINLAAIKTSIEVIDNPVFVEDVAFSGGSVMMSGAIRDDTLSALTPAEGDAVPLRVGSTGALHVTGGGGGTEYTEDAVTPNPIVGTATLIERDDVLSTSVAEADWLGLKGSAEGALWVQDFNSDAILADTAAIDTATAATQTAVEIIDNIVHVDDAAFTLGTDSGVMMMGFAGTQSVNANDAGAIAMETDGAIHIHDGGNTITVDGTVTANAGTNLNTSALLTTTAHDAAFGTAGSADAQVRTIQGVASMTPILTDASATTQPVSGTVTVTATNLDCQSGGADMATAAGQLADGHNVTIDNSTGGSAVNIQDGGNTITVDGTELTDIAAKLAPNTTNGHTPYLNQDTSAIATVKGSAGTLYWLSVQSIDATVVYLNLYDSTTATLGSTTPTNQFIVPTQGDANGSGLTINFGQLGIQYGTGIQVAAATTFNGSVDPGTNVVITNIGFE